MSYYTSSVYIDTQINCLSALADQRAAINPAFAKIIIRNYAQSKLSKGKSRQEVGWKMDALEQELVALRFPNFGAQLIAVRRELNLPPSRIYVNASAAAANPSSISAGTSGSPSARRDGTNAAYPGNAGRNPTTTAAAGSSTAAAAGGTTTRRPARAPVQRVQEGDGTSTPPPAYERMDPNPDADLMAAMMESLRMAHQAQAPEDAQAATLTAAPSAAAEAPAAATPQYAPPPLAVLPPDRTSSPPPSASQVGPEDPVRLLASYDTVVLVDDSTSMATADRWPTTRHLLGALVDLAGQVDAAVELRFLNSDVEGPALDSRVAVDELFHERGEPGGVTALGGRIEEVLLDYLARLEQEREVLAALDSAEAVERLKPLNLIVVTDGHFLKLIRRRPQNNPFLDPTSAPSDDPESVIVAAAKRLDRGNWPLSQLGVFFLQIGDDDDARAALQELDDNLQTTYDVRDIVDTTLYSPDGPSAAVPDGALLRKVLLGGVNRRIDRRD